MLALTGRFAKLCALAIGLGMAAVVATCSPAVGQTAQQNPPANPPPAAKSPLKTQTRLITIDVVATDSHGAPVRGLKADDFRVFDSNHGPQRITQFQFIDATAKAKLAPALAAAPSSTGAAVYSNQSVERLAVPPTVLLMDALNTQIEDQSQVHQHMLKLLETLPSNTPIAVFILGHTLHVVQGFTTDPTLLRAAVDHSLRAQDIAGNPQDDPNSASSTAVALNGDTETPATQALEQFEQMTYVEQTTVRVDETTDAMISIAKYLAGYPGRKNLLWFSSAFPIWISPTSDAGGNPAMGLSPSTTKIPGQEFENSASYKEKVEQATEALTDAQVAVYPVDARGLEPDQIYTTTQSPRINRYNTGASLGSQISRQQGEVENEQATMDAVAEATGGKTCKNTNDLAGCVQAALNDSSAYYELGYSPDGVAWDGKFHKISVKSSEHGVRLRYRDGYFATDVTALAKQSPEKLLEQACRDVLPSTAIPLTVQPIAQTKNSQPSQDAGQVRYLLTIAPAALTLASDSGARRLNLQVALCDYNAKEDSFQLFPRNIARPVSDSLYQTWQSTGLRDIFDYSAKQEDRRIRFAVLDVASGATGAVDAPAHPIQFADLPADLAPPAASGVARANATPAPKPTVTRPIKLTFRSGNNSSQLDWSGDKLWYHGDLGINDGAPAFFKVSYGSAYHCDAGKLVANDPNAPTRPGFTLLFQSPSAGNATVQLDGDAPVYGGTLPVDSTARAFFDYVWKLCHCQQP